MILLEANVLVLAYFIMVEGFPPHFVYWELRFFLTIFVLQLASMVSKDPHIQNCLLKLIKTLLEKDTGMFILSLYLVVLPYIYIYRFWFIVCHI